MFSIEVECLPEQKELLIADLWEAHAAGIVEVSDRLMRAFFEDEVDREAIIDRFHPASWRAEEPRDWVAESRADWEPALVGERFFLVPEWRDDPAPAGRFRIVVNPGMAFGTGRHETTQLCLQALERYVQPGMLVLDVGTGTGILARAAALLGAGTVWACDIDPEAVEIARVNAGANVFIGSADAVRDGAADLITANISPEAAISLAPDFVRCLTPGGIALLSGFQGYEVTAVQTELERRHTMVLEARHQHEWALLAVRVKLDTGA